MIYKHVDFEIPALGELPHSTAFESESYIDLAGSLQPTAYWRLDETTSIVVADAIAPHTYAGSYEPNAASAWTGGTLGQTGAMSQLPVNKAPLFNGSTGYVDFGNVVNPGTESYSVNMWFNVNAFSGSPEFLISNGNRFSTSSGFSVFVQTASAFGIRCNSGSGTTFRAGIKYQVDLTTQTWYMLTLVIDREQDLLLAYLNGDDSGWTPGFAGASSNQLTGFGSITSSDNMLLGAQYNGGSPSFFFDGLIDQVSVFQGQALSPTDIQRLYETGLDQRPSDHIVQSSSSMPDRTGNTPGSLQATVTPNQVGRYLNVELEQTLSSYHVRLAFDMSTMTVGRTTLMQARDTAGETLWRVWYDTDFQQLSAITPAGDQLSVTLPSPAIQWHTFELAFDANSDQWSLRLDGRHVNAITLPSTPRSLAALQLGPNSRGETASGSFNLDELIVADVAIGPVVKTPSSEHADDPARWLVLYNINAADADQWAQAYRDLRDVPYANLVGLDVSTDETIHAAAYLDLEQQVTDYISENHLTTQILGLLCGYGVPGYADLYGNGNQYAVASLLHNPIGTTGGATNPIHDPTANLTRPDITSLNGCFLTARLDAPSLTAANDHLTRIAQRAAFSDFEATQARLFIDPHTSADPQTVAWIAETANWATSVDAMNLGLLREITTHGATPAESDFDTINGDAMFFGYSSGHAPAFNAPTGPRWVAVEAYANNTSTYSLRRTTPATWLENALAVGYLAVGSSSVSQSLDDLPTARTFFEALRRGWTVAEAWMLALPTLRYAAHLVGDPLMTIQTPRQGWSLRGPLTAMHALNASEPNVRTPESQRTLDRLELATPAADEEGLYVLGRFDDSERETIAARPLRMTLHDASLVESPTHAFWPSQASWSPVRKDGQLHFELHLARTFRRANVQTVTLEAITNNDVIATIASLTPDPRARRCDLTQSVPTSTRRYRWQLVSPKGATFSGPWSQAVEPAPTPEHTWASFGESS